ncbi:MAG TPA: 4-hydroxyphenylpyruvate dioxygenase, partial [Bacteroidia bacterium]|nr:4-hydroxyphenylpyruvate dioxygenase [Bacteroidia bacterium]
MATNDLTTVKNFNYSENKKIFEQAQDFLPLLGTDYVEFYVGNAKQAAHYYKTAFGFQDLAYAGLETGVRDRTSYVLQQGKIRLVLTTPLTSSNPIADHIKKHGDGVKVIALWVDDATDAFEQTVKRGAKPYLSPEVLKDKDGEVRRSGIHTYGDTIHIFIERKNYKGIFLPGYEKYQSDYNPPSTGLKYIDHMVGNVELGGMNVWSKFYAEVMGFFNLITFDDKDISTEYTALMSKVMTNGNGYIKFPINEPAIGKKKSQVEEYLDFYEGAGCQHIAVATDDIVHTITEMRKRGVEFLYVPGSYYDTVKERVGIIEEDLEELKKWGI